MKREVKPHALAREPSLRFYRWDYPALSFGYFGKYDDVAEHAAQRDMVRRWTGGGIVFHGEDLTYTLVIPKTAGQFAASSQIIYSSVHCALRDALIAAGSAAELATTESPEKSDSCFATPVIADVMSGDRKVAGAAHRRTRGGLLHQGSIQNVDTSAALAEAFAHRLGSQCSEQPVSPSVYARAEEIAALKYATGAWLHRR